jgi:hypothetical protein
MESPWRNRVGLPMQSIDRIGRRLRVELPDGTVTAELSTKSLQLHSDLVDFARELENRSEDRLISPHDRTNVRRLAETDIRPKEAASDYDPGCVKTRNKITRA